MSSADKYSVLLEQVKGGSIRLTKLSEGQARMPSAPRKLILLARTPRYANCLRLSVEPLESCSGNEPPNRTPHLEQPAQPGAC